ncbi:MAG: hypothetical protein Q4C49_03245, partial [Bacillota bacterium]|nr:hypothetical protein [Bacillota bacterium]
MDMVMGMDMEKMLRNKWIRCFACVMLTFLCSACSPKTIEVPKENALIVCLDEVGVKEKDVSNIDIQEKDGYLIHFDYKNKKYTFKVSSSGLIRSRNVEKTDEPKVEAPVLSEAEKGAKQAALNNAGLTEADVENISVKTNADQTITVRFKIKNEGTTMVTVLDMHGNPLNSYFE